MKRELYKISENLSDSAIDEKAEVSSEDIIQIPKNYLILLKEVRLINLF